MLTIETAQKIGVNACIDKLGRDFVQTHRDSATSSYTTEADEDGMIFCFVGVDNEDRDDSARRDILILDNVSSFRYHASCNVSLDDGRTMFLDCVLPA